MQLREAALFPAVKAWLEARGYAVYAEVPFYSSCIDVVGTKGKSIVAVELKTSLTRKVLCQASLNQLFTRESYAAVATRPRKLDQAREAGVGVLSVHDGRVAVLLDSAGPYTPNPHHVKRILEYCQGEPGDGVGGKPCLLGQGPAQDCKRRVEEYREKHPKATWREIFAAVPNHYASHNSMRQSLTIGLARYAHLREIRRARRKAARTNERPE